MEYKESYANFSIWPSESDSQEFLFQLYICVGSAKVFSIPRLEAKPKRGMMNPPSLALVVEVVCRTPNDQHYAVLLGGKKPNQTCIRVLYVELDSVPYVTDSYVAPAGRFPGGSPGFESRADHCGRPNVPSSLH